MTLKARKDFMVFKQRDLLWSGFVDDFLYARSYVYHYRGKRGRFVTVLWFRDFLARPVLPINRSYFMEKRGRQIFSKTVRASKLTRQRTLEINNAHLDRSHCWQHLQEATKENFLIHGELPQKQIKLYFSSQNRVVI